MEEQEYLIRAHVVLKKLLKEFDRVCKEYNIQYYVICGSLLGAVRHQDLIPWDDDVDVALTRENYNKLLRAADKEWRKGDFCWVKYDELGQGVFLDFMNRLVFLREEIPVNIFNKIKGKGRQDIQNHLAIDVYVLDNACDNLRKHNIQTKAIMGLYGLAMGHRAYINYEEFSDKDKKPQTIIKVLSTMGKAIPLKFIFWIYEHICVRYNRKETNYYFESNGWIFCIPWRFPQSWFGEGTKLKIDGHEICAPADYDAFLRKHYGNYMRLPAIRNRKPTHYEKASGI